VHQSLFTEEQALLLIYGRQVVELHLQYQDFHREHIFLQLQIFMDAVQRIVL
jgi:hypothetical protein